MSHPIFTAASVSPLIAFGRRELTDTEAAWLGEAWVAEYEDPILPAIHEGLKSLRIRRAALAATVPDASFHEGVCPCGNVIAAYLPSRDTEGNREKFGACRWCLEILDEGESRKREMHEALEEAGL